VLDEYATAVRRCKRAIDIETSHLSTEESDVERVKRRKRCHIDTSSPGVYVPPVPAMLNSASSGS